jgi:hypothetical protein
MKASSVRASTLSRDQLDPLEKETVSWLRRLSIADDSGAGPPVATPLARSPSVDRVRLDVRECFFAVDPPRGFNAWPPRSRTAAARAMSAVMTKSPVNLLDDLIVRNVEALWNLDGPDMSGGGCGFADWRSVWS